MQEHRQAIALVGLPRAGGAGIGLEGGSVWRRRTRPHPASLDMCCVWSGVETREWFHPELTHTDNTHSLQQQNSKYCVSIQGLCSLWTKRLCP